jgi:photosystem II stability/assembly factor-like uncharacterized protein
MRSSYVCRSSSALFLTILVLLARPAAAGVDRWTPIGPEGGQIVSLAADPDAPGTLYAGTVGGGVWKSVDGGGSWAPTPEGLPAESISSLAVSSAGVVAGHYYSLYFLADGAAAWRQVGPFPYGVWDIAVDPTKPDRVWAAGDPGGILLSEDGGASWSHKLRLAGSFFGVAIVPTAPPTVYALGGEGIFASTDTGTTWRQIAPVFEPGPAFEFAVDSADAATLYASSPYNSSFWKSTDAGAHWSFSTDFAPGHLLSLPGVLLGADTDLSRSEDGGETWERVALPWWSIFFLEADPTAPAAAWLGVHGGGLLHTADGGRTWESKGQRGLRASTVQAFSFDPFRPGTLYAATLPPPHPAITPAARLQRSVDGGASWSKMPALLNIRSLAADPRRSGTLYAATPRGVSVSRDRGATWTRILREPAGIDAVVVDPNRPGTIWAGGPRLWLWRSQDAGRTWARVPRPDGTSGGSSVRRIFLSPWHPETLFYIDFYLDGFSVPGSLWRSTDGGSTWEEMDGDDPVALAFDPVTPDLLYVADRIEGLRRSRDGGTTWETVVLSVGPSRLTALLVDRLDPSVLYAGTDGGVWRSRDQGATWEPFSTGLIAPQITCLEAYARNPRRLVACAEGGGLLEIRISSGS